MNFEKIVFDKDNLIIYTINRCSINMLKAFKYRLYPDENQKVLLAKTFGCCRKIYNRCLDFKNRRYAEYKQHVSRYELSAMLTFLKSTEEFAYLNEVNSQALQSELVNLDKAFTNFFQHKGGYPTFKSKYERQSFSCPQNSVRFRLSAYRGVA